MVFPKMQTLLVDVAQKCSFLCTSTSFFIKFVYFKRLLLKYGPPLGVKTEPNVQELRFWSCRTTLGRKRESPATPIPEPVNLVG
ncbi:hypothetical protein BpHYR1_040316 [Brachionus plicatilis]|uniref:Uncharacterized protein n=1 Tax=Brachionus plicatilis TaxID=10195 RepID=A0A3M7R7V9_BRAPC|nr:hypothetical protein BpHYR1_040316 [Brachionus plicatilis]